MLVFGVDVNLTLSRLFTLQCFYVLVFVLKENLAHVRFLLRCNVVISNIFVFRLKGNLTCARFFLSCIVVVRNIYMFVLEVNITQAKFFSSYNVVM